MIEVIRLRKSYGAVTAVNDISFTIRRGEIFGLLGPNGAGKTTTIKMLTTLTKPDSGRCIINGIDVVEHPLEIKRSIGAVPQENNLERELTAYENLLIYGILHNVKGMKDKIGEALKMVDLWDRRDTIVTGFSGGMQRRLLLARALLPEPPVLFLDEPSIGLDPQIRRQMWDIIRKNKIAGRTVIITTHYIEEAAALCDTVGILSKGRLIAMDAPQSLRTAVGEYVVEFLNDDGKLIQRMCQDSDEAHELARHGDDGITIRKSNLEDVFVKLTGERIG
ncbi:MAG: ATP-binding cassette domain-containing protein [Deltaproteobacteria bacterium]|nr:ATP-binding cassette domain-containing protein [Deltaproteobacteria bacterium]MBF0524751.1 ATP-binding cassette domain-containing protein [Deltaproteobacteria bacterium]